MYGNLATAKRLKCWCFKCQPFARADVAKFPYQLVDNTGQEMFPLRNRRGITVSLEKMWRTKYFSFFFFPWLHLSLFKPFSKKFLVLQKIRIRLGEIFENLLCSNYSACVSILTCARVVRKHHFTSQIRQSWVKLLSNLHKNARMLEPNASKPTT